MQTPEPSPKPNPEALEAQIAAVEQHLAWLKAQRPAHPSTDPTARQAPPAPKPPPATEAPETTTPEAAAAQTPVSAVAATAPADAHPAAPDTEAERILAQAQPTLTTDQVKFGCALAFIVATALAIFLLFGLPYIFPELAAPPDSQQENTEHPED